MTCSAARIDVAGGGGRPSSAIAQEPRWECRIENGSSSVDASEVGAPCTELGLEAFGDPEFRDRLASVEERNLLATVVFDILAAGEVVKFVGTSRKDVQR
ncbi:hypothetical protein [Nocardia sp. NPDC005998]|uniref:hypothetical protein n=1 Tax=Nocardia sp. NPDC005998 TaxID=3156894 RepID=UPI0033A816D8